MSDSVVGIVGATVGIGQYIVNDYVITIAATEGDYGYTMTITRGTETQTVTLYGLTSEQYDAMLGYLEAAQTAAQNSASSANTAATARNAAQSARNAAQSARDDAQSASETSIQAANAAITARNSALTYMNNAQTAANTANSARSGAEAARSAAVSAKTAAESAATRAETAAGQITGMTAEAETLTPGSPATASFLDGVLSLGIPAGATGATGADGNGIVSIIKTGTQGNVDTYTITYTNGTTSTFTVTNGVDGAVTSVAGKTGAVTLDAGDVEYDDTDTYSAGSVGAGLADLKSQMSAFDYGLDNLTPYDTTRFTAQYATISTPVYDHGYTVVATGSGSATPRISYVLPSVPDIAASDIMYLSFEMYIDAESTEFAANLYQPKSFGHSFGATPISPKQWTLVQKRYTQGATINATGFYAGIDFIDRATASGKTVHLRNMICVDLTKAYGAGQEPDIETINAIVAANDGYFDRYNLFDARKITDDVAAMSTDISNIWDSAYVDLANLYKVANPDNPNDGSIYASKSSATNVAITAGASSSSAAVGDIVYVYGEFKPYSANNNCHNLTIINNTGRHAETSQDVSLPQNDTWYPMSACFVVNNTYAVQVVAEWEQNASIRIYGKHVVAINLTSLFGAYNEPTKVALDRYFYAVSQANAMDFSVVNAKMLNLSSPSRMLTHPYGSYAILDDEGNFKAASVPYSNWSGWQDIGTYGQNNVASIPIYNRFHGTVETDGMISVLPIWGCWSNNAASTGNTHHGGHVFHGWTTDRMHRLTIAQNIYSDDEAAVFNYIPGDKSDTSEGVFLPLRLGADNVYKGMLIEPIYNPNNLANYWMSRVTVYGRLNIGRPQNYNHIPASASADGVKGDICVDSNYIYVCTDTNTWKRVPLETW